MPMESSPAAAVCGDVQAAPAFSSGSFRMVGFSVLLLLADALVQTLRVRGK